MVKACSLHTSEIDMADLAVADILGQLEKTQLLRHSVGIITCHYDAALSGVVEALGKALPFPLVGFTTFYQTVPGASGHFELTITVITSDDVRFTTCYSNMAEQSLAPDIRVQETYLRAAPQGSGTPSLAMSFLTTNRPVTGDEFLRLLDEVTGGVPCFGLRHHRGRGQRQ